MPSNYNGDPSGISAHDVPVIACPIDSDAANAASVNVPFQKLADVLAYLQEHAVLAGVDADENDDTAIGGTLSVNAIGGNKACVETVNGDSAHKLLWKMDGGDANDRMSRLYLNVYGELELAYNCHWEQTSQKWLPDYAETGLRYWLFVLGEAGPQVRYFSRDAESNWGDGDWVTGTALGYDGKVAFLSPTTNATGSNPAATVAVKNELRAKNTPKAWLRFSMATGTPTVLDGFNVESITRSSAVLMVEFAEHMADGNYCVVPTLGECSDATVHRLNASYSRADHGFVLEFLKQDGSCVSAAGIGGCFDFVVFGKQA
jgi:hypothetical protein